MKLQNLTVIFSVIIIPITLILSAYIGSQIDTASLQQSYDTKLMDATHDAVVAFELNTENNNYSTNSESIRRDIRAAINTFSTSLASGLGVPGANSEYIMPYIPAILITMYDGYYIYSPSEYTYNTKELEPDTGTWTETTKTGYTHILKPYVYYSAKYEDSSTGNYIVVNYSLDNYITLYGKIGNEVINKSGYLSMQEFLNNIQDSETLSEHIVYKDPTSSIITGTKNTLKTQFVYKNNQKVYNINGNWYTLTGLDLKPYNGEAINDNGQDTSAKQYKNSSESFMNYLTNKDIGKQITALVTPKNCTSLTSTDTTAILNEDPEDPASLFNQHKREIIRQSIQDNLNNAMAIYNTNSGSMGTNATFEMPKLSEQEWEKILTNVNIVTFMQGLPVGNKIYNNYSIVTSTNNKQYVSPESIYFVDSTNNKYHTIYDINSTDNVTGYKLQDFKKVKYEHTDGTTKYYYRRPEYACYNCMISSHVGQSDESTIYEYVTKTASDVKQKYYTALARERFNLDKVTKIFLNK